MQPTTLTKTDVTVADYDRLRPNSGFTTERHITLTKDPRDCIIRTPGGAAGNRRPRGRVGRERGLAGGLRVSRDGDHERGKSLTTFTRFDTVKTSS